ncbi:MAG: tetratricopeptide repeat protein [Theionarchaea archaeon]|nr:tetratricopeptide repeat protein [Theionarchaea archaeon]
MSAVIVDIINPRKRDRALELKPDFAEAYNNRGNAYLRKEFVKDLCSDISWKGLMRKWGREYWCSYPLRQPIFCCQYVLL